MVRLSLSYLVFFCLFLQTVYCQTSFIEGFEIDNSGAYGRDCEMISASVTSKYNKNVSHQVLFIVINCPREDKYYVFLSKMMTNTTISEIQNEDKDDENFIRRIDVQNSKVTMIKKTNEEENLFKDGLIVVSKNETQGARDD